MYYGCSTAAVYYGNLDRTTTRGTICRICTPRAKKRQTSRLIRFHPIVPSIPPLRPSALSAHSLTRPSNVRRPKFQRVPQTENTIFPFDFCRRPLQYSVSHTSANTPPSLCYKTSRVVRELYTHHRRFQTIMFVRLFFIP